MTLLEWASQHGIDQLNAQAQKFANMKVIREISSTDMDHDDYLKILKEQAPFKARYVFCFVVLENGYAVGWNENPSIGWTTPVVKFKEI